MSDQQPEYVWVFPPEKKRNTGRIWLIVGLSVAAAVIAVLAVWFFLGRGPADPSSSPSPTASASATASPSPSATPSASPTPDVSAAPSPTDAPNPPAPSDPSVSTFRNEVGPILDAASTGLGYARDEGGQAAMQDIMLLQDDAARLNEKVAPSSIASQWSQALGAYARSLEPLRLAYERGTDASAQEKAASTALNDLNTVLGR